MSPLRVFHNIATDLAKRPFKFLPKTEQKRLIKESNDALTTLRRTLEKKNLTKTHAYEKLVVLQKCVNTEEIIEVPFIQHLHNLIEIYGHSANKSEIEKELSAIVPAVEKAKKEILEFHLSLENLEKQTEALSDEEKIKKDLETIRTIGFFYVLEYTLQVLYEFSHRNDEEKKKLMNEGLATEAGNLPAFAPLEGTFKKELCYKILSPDLRDRILRAFYALEETDYTSDTRLAGGAIKQLNLELLRAFHEAGMTTFTAVVYAPFGSDISIDELIQKIENISA